MNGFCRKVTGKQVLRDAATLAADSGIYVVCLFVRAARKIKELVECDKKTERDGAPSAEKITQTA